MIRAFAITAAVAALAVPTLPAVAGAVAPAPPREGFVVIHNAGPSPIAAHVANHTEGTVSLLADEITDDLRD